MHKSSKLTDVNSSHQKIPDTIVKTRDDKHRRSKERYVQNPSKQQRMDGSKSPPLADVEAFNSAQNKTTEQKYAELKLAYNDLLSKCHALAAQKTEDKPKISSRDAKRTISTQPDIAQGESKAGSRKDRGGYRHRGEDRGDDRRTREDDRRGEDRR